MKSITIIILTSFLISSSNCFVPLSLIESVILKFDQFLGVSFGKVSDSMTHEEITRLGVIRSAARYFHDQNQTLINLTKLDTEYKELSNVYGDFYGKFIFLNLPKFKILLIFNFIFQE